MMDGFDLNSALVCEGIVGDGCGGGRIFYIKDEALLVYDPTTKESRVLLRDLYNVLSISKKSCIIKIIFKERELDFDLAQVS